MVRARRFRLPGTGLRVVAVVVEESAGDLQGVEAQRSVDTEEVSGVFEQGRGGVVNEVDGVQECFETGVVESGAVANGSDLFGGAASLLGGGGGRGWGCGLMGQHLGEMVNLWRRQVLKGATECWF